MSSQIESSVELSVVIPCFNEQEVLQTLYERLSACCKACVASSYEVLLIDDGSSDLTWLLIKQISNNDSNFVGVRLSRNHGHQLALTAGLKLCKGNRIFVIDADLQDPPELLSDMMNLMDQGADVVYGRRIQRHGESFFKKVTALIFYRLLSRMSDISLPTDVGDFRLMSRRVVDVLKFYAGGIQVYSRNGRLGRVSAR